MYVRFRDFSRVLVPCGLFSISVGLFGVWLYFTHQPTITNALPAIRTREKQVVAFFT